MKEESTSENTCQVKDAAAEGSYDHTQQDPDSSEQNDRAEKIACARQNGSTQQGSSSRPNDDAEQNGSISQTDSAEQNTCWKYVECSCTQ